MRHVAVALLVSLCLANCSLAAGPTPNADSPDTERVAKIRERIAELTKKPEAKLSVDERLELSRGYLELGQNPLAVRHAFLARQADPENQETWIALIEAQNENLHEVVYAEENFQGAIRKFPAAEKINALREQLFFGQLKFGQPVVAVDHLAAWLKFQLKRENRDDDGDKKTYETADRLIEVLKERRVPIFAIEKLAHELETLGKNLGDADREAVSKLRDKVKQIESNLTPAEKAVKAGPSL